jgi:hypothetical protein
MRQQVRVWTGKHSDLSQPRNGQVRSNLAGSSTSLSFRLKSSFKFSENITYMARVWWLPALPAIKLPRYKLALTFIFKESGTGFIRRKQLTKIMQDIR